MNQKEYLQLLHELPCAASMLIEGRRVRCEVVHHVRRKPAELEHYFGVPLLDKYHSEKSSIGLHKLQRQGWWRMFHIDETDLLAMTAKLVAERIK